MCLSSKWVKSTTHETIKKKWRNFPSDCTGQGNLNIRCKASGCVCPTYSQRYLWRFSQLRLISLSISFCTLTLHLPWLTFSWSYIWCDWFSSQIVKVLEGHGHYQFHPYIFYNTYHSGPQEFCGIKKYIYSKWIVRFYPDFNGGGELMYLSICCGSGTWQSSFQSLNIEIAWDGYYNHQYI